MSELKSKRITFSIEPTIYTRLSKIAPEGKLSEYLSRLILTDLMDRGLVSRQDLEQILYGD